jgi:hypothetical protein
VKHQNEKKRLIFKEKSMVLVLKKGASKKEIELIEKKLKSTKGVDTIKYCGKITLTQDSLTIQKNFRNEWQ